MVFLYKTYPVEYEYIYNHHPSNLLLLHGWGGNKDSFAQIKKIFKSRFNILSISMPPFNNSTVPLDMYDYKNMILSICDLCNVYSTNIICHSFGMRVSLMLATSHLVIEKIVITGGAGIRIKPNIFKKLTTAFRTIFLRSHPEFYINFASSDYVNLSPVDKKTFKNIVNKDLTNYIQFLSCPTFLFWGKRDNATPLKMFKIFKNLKPDCTYKLINNGDHFCYLTHSDLFVDCCEKFLT